MSGEELVTAARSASNDFGVKCSKFSGAVTVELLKRALEEEGIPTSARDVFVRGVPVEIDLVIPRRGEKPSLGLVYEPRQVAVALEIKKTGSFGEQTLQTVRNNFTLLSERKVTYAYVTLEERKNYRWAASEKNLGFRCFTFAWHKATHGPLETTEDWASLVKFLRECL
jgi:hypothetical protein